MTPDRLHDMMEEGRALIAERLGIRARSFAKAVRHAGRLLPAQARQAADYLLELERRLEHPKLAQKVDPAPAEHALATFKAQLRSIEPGKRQAQTRAILGARSAFGLPSSWLCLSRCWFGAGSSDPTPTAQCAG
ncbi:hypothetical protein QTA57_08610 [Fontisubflavum oceani]|uniref:hypothetical protein n=1 Tax=Fontisubflavum oceani TaxID=2978973 RepID=UPI0025B42833|nr:hypothetical protein [Fontisubflavum oceani]WJY23114.1 hypothetical protein QTA57_08610 [Fontisubflavum oceani]